jgi:hypothetical protein
MTRDWTGGHVAKYILEIDASEIELREIRSFQVNALKSQISCARRGHQGSDNVRPSKRFILRILLSFQHELLQRTNERVNPEEFAFLKDT